MQDFLPFIVIGVMTGSVSGLAGTGLVLTHKASGIFSRVVERADSTYLLIRGEIVFSGAADQLAGREVLKRYFGIEIGVGQ